MTPNRSASWPLTFSIKQSSLRSRYDLAGCGSGCVFLYGAKNRMPPFSQAAGIDAGRIGQGKVWKVWGKSLIFRWAPRRLCSEWNL
jgi:hypothetical protein